MKLSVLIKALQRIMGCAWENKMPAIVIFLVSGLLYLIFVEILR